MDVKIPTSNLPRLRKQMAQINRSLVKVGGEPIAIIERGQDVDQLIHALAGIKQPVQMSRVSIDQPALTLGDWTIAAHVERVDDVVFVDGKEDVPKRYRDPGLAIQCEHCEKSRARKLGFVLRHRQRQENYIQVGSTCLDHFTNTLDAQRLASAWHRAEKKIAKAADVASIPQWDTQFELHAPTARLVALVQDHKARQGSRWGSNLNQLFHDACKEDVTPTPAAIDKAAEVIKWAAGLDDEVSSDRLHNAKALLSGDWIPQRSSWRVLKVLDAYEASLQPPVPLPLAQKYADNLGTGWVGVIGNTFEGTVQVAEIVGFMGYYGPTNLYKFRNDNGNTLIYFTGKRPWEQGAHLKITGTIKKHTTYRKLRQTQLARVRVAD